MKKLHRKEPIKSTPNEPMTSRIKKRTNPISGQVIRTFLVPSTRSSCGVHGRRSAQRPGASCARLCFVIQFTELISGSCFWLLLINQLKFQRSQTITSDISGDLSGIPTPRGRPEENEDKETCPADLCCSDLDSSRPWKDSWLYPGDSWRLSKTDSEGG